MKRACIVVVLALAVLGCANRVPPVQASSKAVAPASPARAPVRSGGLRRDLEKIGSLNLFYGPGGKEHQPAGKFTFVKEDKEGSAPKFEVVDAQGVHWKVKLGEETKSETAATRLVWAAGYFTDEDYYLPELRVEKMPRLSRGRKYVSKGGIVHGVRLERKVEGQKKIGNWSWFKNPYAGTKELDGLKIMMALMNNWDLKEVNNAIYQEQGEKPRYVISDLGATFGRTGNTLVRSKSNLRDYQRTKFIQKVKPEEVDFFLSSRPFFPTAIAVPNYVSRTRMQGIVKHISRTHAKWLGQLLAQLSTEQIRDCFRAGGYSPEETAGFAKVVQGRIAELDRL
ncbi:MAG TPA: hypothetical protein VLN48_07765 [Bryobacteraceae bacterium]|nr:hypothetical protein [Bryobacteraceae bacterium]